MLRTISNARMVTKEWGTKKLCEKYQVLSVNQHIIKIRLLEVWKALKINNHPLKYMFESELNKNISTTNMTARGSGKSNLKPVFKKQTI